MIWESGPWKYQLSKSAKRIEKWRKQSRWTEASLVAIEQEVFFAFYGIRKLIEARTKLSFECRDTQIPVLKHNTKAKKADLMNWHKLDELYDLEHHKKSQMCLRDLCNSFIHSYVFVACVGPDGFEGVLFNTDRNKHECLFFLKAEKLQQLLERVATDDVVRMTMLRMPDGEFKVFMASNKIPPEELKRASAEVEALNHRCATPSSVAEARQ